jgi:hypothetical protein
MIINFIGNYANGYVGEISDENHLAREMERQGHTVRRIPRDEWREAVIENFPEGKYRNVPTQLQADINIIAKWHHFYSGEFIEKLREKSGAPVLYWCWDYMWDQNFPDWHLKMAQAADLYLSNEGGLAQQYAKFGVKHYYFPFDVCDGDIPKAGMPPNKYDVVFLGSFLGQGERLEYIKKINAAFPVTVFSWNYAEWDKIGIKANPPVWGAECNKVIKESKIVLGFNVNPHCWGYWSNRVGKTIQAGGFLLQQYAPGMELLLGDNVEYFSSPEEAIEKISFYLSHEPSRKEFLWKVQALEDKFTSKHRVKQLMIMAERFIKESNGKDWNKLPI